MKRRRELLISVCAGILSIGLMACGNNAVTETTVPASEAESTENTSESTDKNSEDMINTDADSQVEELTETEESQEEEKVEEKFDYEAVINSYDNLLYINYSNGGPVAYLGYHIPEGWEQRVIDGEESTGLAKSTDDLYNNVGEIFISQGGWDLAYGYQPYQEAIHTFYDTGIYEEPERTAYYYNRWESCLTNLTKEGEIETPYGKAILYTAITELIEIDEDAYNEEESGYDVSKGKHLAWNLTEGALIPTIDDIFVMIEYNINSGDWFWSSSSDSELPGSFINHEYTGTLDEVIPLMFN